MFQATGKFTPTSKVHVVYHECYSFLPDAETPHFVDQEKERRCFVLAGFTTRAFSLEVLPNPQMTLPVPSQI